MSPNTAITYSADDKHTGLTLDELETFIGHAKMSGATGTEYPRLVINLRGAAKKVSVTITGREETSR